jgi:adenylosuccinate synthase
MSTQNMSLFIPAVFKNITKERVISAFEKVKLGKVSHVNFIDKNEKFNSVHICFSYWNNTDASRIFQQKAKTSEGAKLVYDDPWHWVVLEYRQKHYEKYVEVTLNYLTDIERENADLLRENERLKNQLQHNSKSYKKATNKIQQLEEQLIVMETNLREYDYHSKIYIDEIISLKNKIATIEEGEIDEGRGNN